MFGKTVQSLINKPCSILTIQEGYNDPTVIPPILNQLKGMSKIFVLQFRPRGAFIDAVIIKSFDDDVQPLSLPAPTTVPSTETISSIISFDPETPQVEGKKTAKRQLAFTKPLSGEEKSRYITIYILFSISKCPYLTYIFIFHKLLNNLIYYYFNSHHQPPQLQMKILSPNNFSKKYKKST